MLTPRYSKGHPLSSSQTFSRSPRKFIDQHQVESFIMSQMSTDRANSRNDNITIGKTIERTTRREPRSRHMKKAGGTSLERKVATFLEFDSAQIESKDLVRSGELSNQQTTQRYQEGQRIQKLHKIIANHKKCNMQLTNKYKKLKTQYLQSKKIAQSLKTKVQTIEKRQKIQNEQMISSYKRETPSIYQKIKKIEYSRPQKQTDKTKIMPRDGDKLGSQTCHRKHNFKILKVFSYSVHGVNIKNILTHELISQKVFVDQKSTKPENQRLKDFNQTLPNIQKFLNQRVKGYFNQKVFKQDLQKQLLELPFFIKPEANKQYYQILTNYLFSSGSEDMIVRGDVFYKLLHFIGHIQLLSIDEVTSLKQDIKDKLIGNMTKIIDDIEKEEKISGAISEHKLRAILQVNTFTTQEIQFLISKRALESVDLDHLNMK